jgi:hypothetical protein
MRQTAGVLNRIWLAILGIVALLTGAALFLAAGGQLSALTGVPLAGPVITTDAQAMFTSPLAAAVVLAAGLILAILGLLWIIAQIPRKNPAPPYRLHEDPATGFTTCDTAVVAAAVEQRIDGLPGVISSSAVLRGTSTAPELTAKVTVDSRADVQDVIAGIQTTVLPELSTALETRLRRVGLQFEVDSKSQNTGVILQ